MLNVKAINTFYGSSQVLFNFSLEVREGEVVGLIGRNGAGKTTTLRSIMGLARVRDGRIFFKGQDITNMSPYVRSRLGIGYVPENRLIFPDLTVLDNLWIAEKRGRTTQRWDRGSIFELFPVLKARKDQKGGTLSGGEQQMLTIARALIGNPELMLIDEPTEGLAPLIVRAIKDLIVDLGNRGQTILLSEQNLKFTIKVTNKIYIIEKGAIVYEDTPIGLSQNESIIKKYLAL
ncbi:MAG: ABC transporter ATP-binding protein [Candidatus Methanomethylicaceae archaeon]